MTGYRHDDIALIRMLRETRTIALIGASAKPGRDSHQVMRYMQASGFRVIPINPTMSGSELLGETVHASLADVPDTVDMVDVFRRRDAVPGIVDEVIAAKDDKNIRFLWLQIGVTHPQAEATARAAGLDVVADRCLKIEYGRLLSHV